MSNESQVNTRALLQQLNDDKAAVLVPAMVVLGLLMAMGLFGNGLVCFFYGCKTKTTPATVFILALAIFDLLSCTVAIPVEIADMTLFYTFESNPACKLLVFVNHFATISSAFTLCAIAIDRYRRICKPFDRQLSIKKAKIITMVCAAGGVVLGWPACVLYTVELVPINNTYNIDITGFDCTSVKDEAYEPYQWTYNAIQFIGFIVVFLALVVSYFFVGRQLYKHKKFRFYVASKSLRRTASGTTIYSGTETTDPVMSHSTTLPPSIPEEMEIDDVDDIAEIYEPPETSESFPDLRELVTGGLPMVDTDRPSSGRLVVMEIDDERPVRRSHSVRTGISGTSKRSIRSVKSVTICEPDENQIFSIEPRDKSSGLSWRPGSARSMSTWSNSITRPNSVSSIATFSTRPDSVASSRPDSVSGDAPKELKRPSSGGSRGSRSNVVRPETSETPPATNVNVPRTSSLRRTASSDSAKMNTDTDTAKDLRMKMLDINTIKYTIIMLVIAVVFIVSCLPYLCLAVWRSYADDDLVYTFSDAEQVWFQIGIRSYFLNCAINPLIYGFFNSQFREFFSAFFCACCKGTTTTSKVKRSKASTSPVNSRSN